MGKSILIIVLGMSVIVGFFILKLSANSKENLSTTVNMFEQTQARLIANSGVEIYLEKLKEDNSIKGKHLLITACLEELMMLTLQDLIVLLWLHQLRLLWG